MPHDFNDYVKLGSPLLHTKSPENTKGLLALDNEVMLVASSPILTRERKGPVHGTMLMGRLLGLAELKRLREVIHLTFELKKIDSKVNAADTERTLAAITPAKPMFTQIIDANTVAGHAVLTDVYGKPAMFLTVTIPRSTYAVGRRLSITFALMLMVMGAIFTGLMFLIIRRVTLARTASLVREVQNVESAGNLRTRVTVDGSDELTTLATGINRMMQALERSEEKIRASEERYRGVVEDQTELICRYTMPQMRLTFVNSTFSRFFEVEVENIVRRQLLEFYPEAEHEQILERMHSLCSTKPVMVYEQQLELLEGRSHWLHWTNRAIFNRYGDIVEVQSVGRDITSLKKVEAELRQLSITDALTGAYNRRYFLQRLREEFDRVDRYGRPLTVAIIDIDHFKGINDIYGHQVGDRVLIALTGVALQRLRAVDVFARWGGEEFIILFPETPLDGGHDALLELCGRLSEIELMVDGSHVQFTVSAGIAERKIGERISPEELIRAADTALYDAKNAGRNRVVCCKQSV